MASLDDHALAPGSRIGSRIDAHTASCMESAGPAGGGRSPWIGAWAAGVGWRLRPAINRPLDILAGARGRLFLVVPVLLGLGIAIYFSLAAEPSRGAVMAVGAGALGCGLMWWRGPERWQPVFAGLLAIAAGFWLAADRAERVAAPVLAFRYYGPIEGRLVEIDRSNRDRLRITLDQVVLQRTDAARTPVSVRLSLMSDQPHVVLEPGLRVMLTGHLSPPGEPVEPGAFDFRRHAWFERLGAIGYTRDPVMVLAPAEEGAAGLALNRLRRTLSEAVRARIPGDAGGFVAAVTTGDRSGVSAQVNDAMRASNLYHILSISGMHMAMLAGFVFAVVRRGIALVPWLALRLPVKKVAAVVALVVSAFYLALAGRDVATERSFIMVAMMLVAVLFDRRAISLRSVALAGVLVLMLRPESLMNAGFQMSFAATVALVAAFGWIAGWDRLWPRLIDGIAMLVFSSAVAGAATLPFAAAHFNRIAEYGLVANLLAAPAMGVLVMPGAVIAAVLTPLGLDGPALWFAGLGAEWILHVARVIAGLEGAVSAVATPHWIVLPMITLGGVWLVLVSGRNRWWGVLPMLAAMAFWVAVPRPGLIIAASGGISGVMTETGRALTKPSGDSYATESWLMRDGEMVTPAVAGSRAGVERSPGLARYAFAGREVVHVSGKGSGARAVDECRPGRIVISQEDVPLRAPDCLLFDKASLARSGALSVRDSGDGLVVTSVRGTEGDRPWTRPKQGRRPGMPPAGIFSDRK